MGLPDIFNEENCEIIQLYPENEEFDFWEGKGKRIKIHLSKFLDKLEKSGFRLYPIKLDYIFVQVKDNIVEEVATGKMKDLIWDYLSEPGEEFSEEVGHNVLEKVLEISPRLFSVGLLEFLERLKGDFKRDTEFESSIYFKNCFVSVTKDNYIIHDYKDLDKYVWRSQLIDRDFYPSEKESDFRKFVMGVCRFDEKRFNALRSAIGYLLQTYRNCADTKAIIFMDEKQSNEANGGTGKSLIADAISRVRKTLKLDGRFFRFDRFSFQSFRQGTNIISINDLKKGFDFQSLFPLITDNLVMERKFHSQLIIPFEDTPKLVLTTNYAILGDGGSFLRRQFVIEFSDYYNMNYTPRDEFDKMFFYEWNQEDWDSFYMFMIDCLQYFLKNGLVEYERVNLERKKLLDSTSVEFIEFIESIKTDTWYEKKVVYEKFISEYPDYSRLRQQIFTQWIMTYARYNKYTYEQKRTGDVRKFMIRTADNVERKDE